MLPGPLDRSHPTPAESKRRPRIPCGQLTQQRVGAALAHGSAVGDQSAIAEATNRTSQHTFDKAGFTTRARASYADYRRDGVAVFASISEHRGPAAMVRKLGPQTR